MMGKTYIIDFGSVSFREESIYIQEVKVFHPWNIYTWSKKSCSGWYLQYNCIILWLLSSQNYNSYIEENNGDI